MPRAASQRAASSRNAIRLTAQEASKLDNTWTDPARGRIRFADWATEWWQDWSPGKAPATLEATESHLRLHIRPYFDRHRLNTIDAQVVQRWQNELAGRTSHNLPPSQLIDPGRYGVGLLLLCCSLLRSARFANACGLVPDKTRVSAYHGELRREPPTSSGVSVAIERGRRR